MAYKYCDWTNGNDLSGDGTAILPYKSIQKASTGLTGGDVVRVAKSPDHVALSGTLTFVDGSASVATSVDLTGELAINDLVGKNSDDMCWWRVSDRNASSITLSTVYSGTSQGAVSAYKMNAHNMGTAATQYVALDIISVNGVSRTNRLKVSGGWDLSTETQNGESFFKQTGSSQWGYALQLNANYIEVEKIHGARFNDAFIWSESKTGCCVHDVGAYSCNRSGILTNRYNTYMTFGGTINISQSGSYGFYDYGYTKTSSHHSGEGEIILRSCYAGPTLPGNNQYWKKFTIKRTTTWSAINIYGDNVRIAELIIENALGAIYCSNSVGANIIIGKLTVISCPDAIGTPLGTILVYHYIPTAVGTDISYYEGCDQTGRPAVIIQRYGNTNYSGRMYFRGLGIIYQDATNARTLRCLKFAPTHATVPLAWSIGNVKCMNTNLDIDLSVYIKKGGGLDGTIQIAAFVLGQKVVDWTTVAATTSYAQYTITVPSSNLVMTEYVELQVRVSGTSGYAYIDDFSVSQ